MKLECRAPCREGGGKETCAVRDCAVGKGMDGCWECDDSGKCGLLIPLRSFHPNLGHNLEMIKKYGIDKWSDKRGKHYNWS